MDPIVLYLAKLIGLALLFVGLALVFKPHDFQSTAKDVSQSNAMMTLISILPLVVGLSVILGYNVWSYSWTVIIPIFGWLVFICGLIRLFFHKSIMHCMAKCSESKAGFVVVGIIFVVVGAFLSYKGFYL